MKTTIAEVLWLQQAVKSLMGDGELTIKCKLDLVTLAEEVDSLLKPFNTLRAEIMTKHTKNDEATWAPKVNEEMFRLDIIEAIEGELETSIDGFTLITSETDKNVTPQTLAILKKFFWDKFILETK